MKKGLFIALFATTCMPALIKAQQMNKNWYKGMIFFDFVTTDKRFMTRQSMLLGARDTAVWEALDFENTHKDTSAQTKPKSSIMLGVKLDPNLTEFYEVDVKSISKNFSSFRVPDSSDARLIALGITPENAKDYQYHVVQDDSIELVPWSPVRQLEQHYGAKRPYAFLGRFKAPGKQIMVEVVNRNNYSIRDGVIFDWRRDFQPVITEVDAVARGNRYWNLHSTKGKPYASRFDPGTNLPLDLAFPVDSLDELQMTFKHHETQPYVLRLVRLRDSKLDTSVLSWWFLEDYYHFDSKEFNKPGHYELVVQTSGVYDSAHTVRIPFDVLYPMLRLQRKLPLEQVLMYSLGVLALIAILFGLYYSRNRRLLRRSQQARQIAALQLKAIRSQLNPHFMFNALSSIQSLMNRNDVPRANHYLSTFAGLTRKVLLSGDQELISIEDEVSILDDYLAMEQLRFGFQYQVQVDPAINRNNLEIPSMMLQPFVENAVKHGVNGLQEEGRITVSIGVSGKDLLLKVTDNGNGFDKEAPAAEGNGFGLKLGAERLKLLNQLHKESTADLHIQSGPEGTTISITLFSWLS